MLSKYCLVMIGLSGLVAVGTACPEHPQTDNRYDPCPAQGDFVLPMPADLKMVFRKVTVPGRDFWADSRRIIQVGDPMGGIFEGRQKTMIGGAFPVLDAPPRWEYYLGKYEVTKAQFTAVLGDGDIRRGIARLIEVSGNPDDQELAGLSGEPLSRALAFPVAWVGWLAVQEFIHAYNSWCYADFVCHRAMPVIKAQDDREGAPGFFRLPTELEWEYAARGGLEALNAQKFEAELPFERTEWKKYAFVQPEAKAKPRRIGTLEATFGFYDLFGNVQELTADLFRAELGQGKAGGLTARGGSYFTQNKDLRSAYRREVGLYQVQNDKIVEGRYPTTGFRLAIAGLVIPTPKYQTQLEQEYEVYKHQLRDQTPAGESLISRSVQVSNTLQTVKNALSALVDKPLLEDADRQQKLTELTSQLQTAMQDLDLSNQKVCDSYVEQAVIFSNLMVRSYREHLKQFNLIDILGKKQNLSARDQQNIASLRAAAEHEEKQTAFYFNKYAGEINKLASCGNRLAQRSVENFKAEIVQGNVSPVEKEAFDLFLIHLADFTSGNGPSDRWREQVIKVFEEKQLLMYL